MRLAVIAVAGFLVVACGAEAPSPVTTQTAMATAAPTTTPAATATAASSAGPSSSPGDAATVTVTLLDTMEIEPATMTVRAGQPVTFVVTNSGAIDHEFFIGDEAEQAVHEQEMQDMDGMMHDEEMGIVVEPGQTKELTVTFAAAGQTLAGCHVPGHYPAGMRATIEIEP